MKQEESNNREMHRLLQRQLKKLLPGYPHIPDEMRALFHAINESYYHYDNDRLLVETAMRESSDELSGKRAQLKAMLDHQSVVIDSLKHAVSKLLPGHAILRDDDLIRIADFLQDEITRRQKAENQKEQSEQRLLSILNSLNLGMVEYDLEGKLNTVHDNFASLFGYQASDLHGTGANFLMSGEGVFLDKNAQQVFRYSCRNEVFEAPLVKSNGETIWVLCNTTPIYDMANNVSGGVMVVFDITDQKKLESQLRHAQRAAEAGLEVRKSILANVSHELRTPVNAIVGMSSLLSATELTSVQKQYIETLKFSSDGLLVLIDDLLDVSRIESGKVELENIPFSLDKILCALSISLGLKAREKGLQFKYSIDPLISDYLFGDPHRFNQILTNLISNAIKFTAKGEIKVSITLVEQRSDDQFIQVSVIDSGIGIAENRLNAIFQEFSQEDTSTSRKYGGTGLGLTISKKLVEMMGGNLKVTSVKNVGSEFYFSIVLRKSEEPEKVNENFNPDLSDKRILLVEDNPINQYLAMTLLKSWNAHVVMCNDGQEAIDAINQDVYDVILMDLQMPMLDGFETTEILRNEMRIMIPIIALTANAINGERDQCLALGMNEYVSKPFQPELLYKKILNVTGDKDEGASGISEDMRRA
jgi:two-component system, sensor histidine kinase